MEPLSNCSRQSERDGLGQLEREPPGQGALPGRAVSLPHDPRWIGYRWGASWPPGLRGAVLSALESDFSQDHNLVSSDSERVMA